MRRVTIRDVAAEAGVSIGTASKALNGQGKLRAETRERVAERRSVSASPRTRWPRPCSRAARSPWG